MRNTMLSLLAVAGTVLTLGAAVSPSAQATPVQPGLIAPATAPLGARSDDDAPRVQNVYYYGRPGWHHRDWRWRHHDWRWRHRHYGYGRPY